MRRRSSTTSLLLVLTCAAFPGALAAFACSDDTPSATATAPDADVDARRKDGQAPDEDVEDTGGDAYVPPVNLPACVGSSIPMTLDGVRAFVGVPIGSLPDGGYAANGEFVLDFGSTGSTIDLNKGFDDAGAPTPTSCAGDASAPGADCTFQGFDFFGDWGTVYLRTADHSILFGSVRQSGILATDFLSKNPFALDFTKKQIHRNDPATFCTDAQLLGSGFRPLPAGGFYATDLSKLRPLSEVLDDPDASAGYVVPNVPTVPITVAGSSALAQLDTGYEDRLSRRSLNINEALFNLMNAQPGLLTRYVLNDLYVTTCVPGLNEKLEAYILAPNKTLDFVGEGGAVARTEPIEAVYLKHRTPETFKCGGISTWTAPAAQVGASFFIDAQALVIDPTSSRVWVPKN